MSGFTPTPPRSITPPAPPRSSAPVCAAPAPVEPFAPFPVYALPEPFRGFVNVGAGAIGCDPSYVALPLLAAAASAIGNTRRIGLKRGWTEPAIIWTAIVGDSGTLKSPAIELALRAVRERQRKAMREHADAMERYVADRLRYDADEGAWKARRKRLGEAAGDPPAKPEEPIADRCWTDDATVEAMAVLLLRQPRGLLMARDELSGWFAFDRYASSRGGDAAKWLEAFGGRPLVVDRKTSGTIYVPRAAVSITGGIQPETLRRALGTEHRENGLLARLLLAWPPRRSKRWTEADIDPSTEAAVASIFDRLYALEPEYDAEGDPRPVLVPLRPEAKRAWIEFYNAHAREHVDLTGDLSAAWSKLEGYAARLALVVHLIRAAASDPTLRSLNAVDDLSIMAGVVLSGWFGGEARRVYAMLGESEEDRDRRRLVELIRRKGGSVTPRDLMRSSRLFSTAEDAERALDGLAGAGFGRWEPIQAGPKGGRPGRRFRLVDTADVDTTHENMAIEAVVSTSTPSTGADDEWGEL